jgi:hypothetical protein
MTDKLPVKVIPAKTVSATKINPPKKSASPSKSPAKHRNPADKSPATYSPDKTTTIIHKKASASPTAKAGKYFHASHGRAWIAIEIIVGSFCILTHVSPTDSDKNFSDTVKQEAAFLFAMLILSLMANAGPSGANISAALGGVIVLTIMLKTGDPISRVLPGITKKPVSIPQANLSGNAPGGGLQSA